MARVQLVAKKVPDRLWYNSSDFDSEDEKKVREVKKDRREQNQRRSGVARKLPVTLRPLRTRKVRVSYNEEDSEDLGDRTTETEDLSDDENGAPRSS